MAYYPKSQVQTNQYAEPGKLLKEDFTPYTGYYWENSQGEIWSGKTPQDLPSVKLIPAFDPENNELQPPIESYSISIVVSDDDQYNNIKGISPGDPSNYQIIPPFFQTYPTQQDYQIGEFRRYFCKKSNELIYLEISKKIYDLLVIKDPQILWQLYFPFEIPWTLTGDKQQAARTNRNIVLLTQTRLSLPKFDLYLKEDYLKYCQFTNASNLYTAGGEYKTADGKNYIGYYHIHDKTGPMVGATHIKESHGLLFPINTTSSYTPPSNNYSPPSIGRRGGGGGGY